MLKPIIKDLKKTIKKAYDSPLLYTNEEVVYMKKQLRQYENLHRINVLSQSRGFGNELEKLSQQYENKLSQTSVSDSRSGADDGVCSESEQPEQSGESECSGSTEVLHQT